MCELCGVVGAVQGQGAAWGATLRSWGRKNRLEVKSCRIRGVGLIQAGRCDCAERFQF